MLKNKMMDMFSINQKTGDLGRCTWRDGQCNNVARHDIFGDRVCDACLERAMFKRKAEELESALGLG